MPNGYLTCLFTSNRSLLATDVPSIFRKFQWNSPFAAHSYQPLLPSAGSTSPADAPSENSPLLGGLELYIFGTESQDTPQADCASEQSCQSGWWPTTQNHNSHANGNMI
jgi:hypothetical protein